MPTNEYWVTARRVDASGSVASCKDAPPKIIGIDHELWVETDEPQRRLNLLHHNVRNFSTIFNTVLAACPLEGAIHRGVPPWRREANRGADSLEARS